MHIKRLEISSPQELEQFETFYTAHSIETSFWTIESLCVSLKKDTLRLFQIFIDQKLSGFYLILKQPEQTELLYIYIATSKRRQGIAEKLLIHLKSNFLLKAGNKVHLEVRASNSPAIKLYQSMGFSTVGTRDNYYKDGEDALLMMLEKDNSLV